MDIWVVTCKLDYDGVFSEMVVSDRANIRLLHLGLDVRNPVFGVCSADQPAH